MYIDIETDQKPEFESEDIMGIFDKLRKGTKSIFSFDEKNKQYKAIINNITFACKEIRPEYEQYAKDLANNYDRKMLDIIQYMLSDIEEMFGISDVEIIKNSLGNALIDLDNNRLSYLEQTLDDVHIIDVEFDGIFEKFYDVSIDG